MNYEDRVVCFIDILGFRSHVADTVDENGNENIVATNNLIEAFKVIKNAHVIEIEDSTKMLTQFSDCLVISFEHSQESGVFWTLVEIQWLLLELVQYGILCRGGITFGKLVHTNDIVFGPALVDAYTLESKAANYPRVLVDNSILEVAAKHHGIHHAPDHEIDSVKKCLGLDSDGMHYVDYILEVAGEFDRVEEDYVVFLKKLGDLISKHVHSKKPDIRVKYSWLKEKYNEAVEYYQKCYVPKCTDPDLANSFMNLPIFK